MPNTNLPIPLITQLRGNLEILSNQIHNMLEHTDITKTDILNDFEELHQLFHDVQVNAASFYLRSFLAPFTDQFEVLSTAIQHLSKRNHGALIVIQRHDHLDSFIHSGINVQAKLSSPLLESIFYTGNPLHDGAVLICKDRIVSAGNVLPLSTKEIHLKVGTRHRAAIGITELTDTLVLVVSEETGRATFALSGNLYPIMTKGLT
ncbi:MULTISPECIES: sporulation-specific diadenylate cyclase CdaS [Bacillaceae]|uniref:sporulation-specific diadenylate cyclase CdaS n=1 Tax=Bacillaceae TaxID=186817 RepID=UPI0011A2FA9A|nr:MULTISPECIES: sporulation-specific diadenylate cyclase CdaS [Bacillaceae]MBU8790852.1 sporulation-specific diadenylate cyclase CdaS [Oceanobacillus caeni]